MSHYDEVLSEARKKASGTAKEYIPRLYHILVDEENKTPEDARDIIEHDLIEYWAKSTVKKFLPHEAKDEIKQEAGKKGAEKKKIMLLADGSRARMEFQQKDEVEDLIDKNVPVKDSTQFYAEQKGESEEPTELELANIKIAQLEDALHKTEQFKPATALEKVEQEYITNEDKVFDWLANRDDKIKCFYFGSCGTGYIKANILKNLENSGIKTFKRLYFEV